MRLRGVGDEPVAALDFDTAPHRSGNHALLVRLDTDVAPGAAGASPRVVAMSERLQQLVGQQPSWADGLSLDELLPGLDPDVPARVAASGQPVTTPAAVIVRPGRPDGPTTDLLVLPVTPLTPPETADLAADGDYPGDPLFELAFSGAPVGMAITTTDGVLLRVNHALAQILGRVPADLVGVSLETIGAPDDGRAATSPPPDGSPDGVPGGAPGGPVARDRRAALPPTRARPFVHRTGRIVWLRVSAADVDCGSLRLTVNHFVDVTAERRVAQQMAHAATHDELTGLPNRAWLFAALQTALNGVSETALALGGRTPAVLFVDLDDFKGVNDSLGHEAGDRLLRQVAQRLRRTVRPEDAVARFGGDELVVLCQDLPAGEPADQMCRRLLATISEPVEVDGRAITVGASVGVAHADPTSTPQSLLRDADSAMYSAKRAGRNRYVVSDELLRGFALAALTEESELRAALDDRLLELRIAPVRRLPTLRISAVDTAVAWRHPVRGLLEHDYCVGLADRTGLSRIMGQFSLDEACRRLPDWRRQSHEPQLRATVALSVEHLEHPEVVSDVRHALQRHRVEPRSLMIAVPERALINDSRTVVAHLEELDEEGVRLVLADFGSGYSALSLLRKLPVGGLGLDRGFVSGARDGGRGAILLRSIAQLGAAMGLEVRATGVESADDLRATQAAGCTHVQGPYVGAMADRAEWPQPPDTAEDDGRDTTVVPMARRSRRS